MLVTAAQGIYINSICPCSLALLPLGSTFHFWALNWPSGSPLLWWRWHKLCAIISSQLSWTRSSLALVILDTACVTKGWIKPQNCNAHELTTACENMYLTKQEPDHIWKYYCGSKCTTEIVITQTTPSPETPIWQNTIIQICVPRAILL